MTSIEQTGRTVEEATQAALGVLGLTEDEVDVEILEEGSKGFLGLGQAPARVRVTPKSQARMKETARKAQVEKTTEPPQQPAPAATATTDASTPSPAPVATGAALDKAAEASAEMLQRILDVVSPGAKAVVKSKADGQIILDMVGGEAAVLIGKHGQTIDAMQYLVGVITNKKSPERVRVILDTEGYRARREEALKSQAIYLAKKVKESGQEAVLDALHANERRIIHTTLADDPDVYTYSEGEEPDRRVVISPRK